MGEKVKYLLCYILNRTAILVVGMLSDKYGVMLRILIQKNEIFLKYGIRCVHSGKKRRQDFRLKKSQNGCQNGLQNQFFEIILLGTNIREKSQESKNKKQKKCFKRLYRTPSMLHRFSTTGDFM